MAKPSELLMDGKLFDPDSQSPTLAQIKKFLDSQPANEVFTILKLRELSKVSEISLRRFSRNEQVAAPYVYRGKGGNGNTLWFGNPKAIVLLKKKMGAL